MEARRDAAAVTSSAETVERLVENLARVVHAPVDTLQLIVLALVAEGHVIVEDFPGVGKTMLAKSLARSLDLDFSRIQFTPDLLPSDVTGVNVFNQRTNEFEFRPGPVFANVLLVDEINRASPKTQAALLEAMQESQVTIDGESYPLDRPFMVIATQNPIEYEGTYPLPEAQLDRFSMKLSLGYPQLADEARMLNEQTTEPPLDSLVPVATLAEVTAAVDEARSLFVEESLNRYVVALLRHTRGSSRLALGASPRSGIALLRVAKARALAEGRDYVLPDDVKAIARARARTPAHPRAGGALRRAYRRGDRRRGGRADPRPRLGRDPARLADAAAGCGDVRRRLALRREGPLPGRDRARARADRRLRLGVARGGADGAAAAGGQGRPARRRRRLGQPRRPARVPPAGGRTRDHRDDRPFRRAGDDDVPCRRPLPRHVRARARAARALRGRAGAGDDRRPLRARPHGRRPRRARVAPRLPAARPRSTGSSPRAAPTPRTAGGCCCGARPASISTRCASTSRGSRSGRCTGRRRRAAGS